MDNNITSINITISDYSDICNKFNSNMLSEELSNYIYNECKGKPLKNKVKININSLFELDDDQKEKIVDMIRSNFGIDIKENLLYLKYINIPRIILFIIGIILVFIYTFFDSLNISWLAEIILIIGWLVIWEAAYNYLFLGTKKRMQVKRLKKLTCCEINFIDEK